MNYNEITGRFYDKWLGREGMFSGGNGVEFLYSDERNLKQYGYPDKFDVFALLRPGRAVISYGDAAADRINDVKAALGEGFSVEELKNVLEGVYGIKPAHSVKFVYVGGRDIPTTARALAAGDEEKYVEFFRDAHPNGETDWIYEYFDEMAEEGGTFCAWADGKIVSCADSPGMPYMQDEVQEIGVATLPEYRRRGFALDACAAAANKHISAGKCPVWSASWDNFASHALAERVGFEKYADAVMVSLG